MRKKVQKQERVEFRMDAALLAQVKLRLYSELEECVPYGALSAYIIGLIRSDMAKFQAGVQDAPITQTDGHVQLHNGQGDPLLRGLQGSPGEQEVERAVSQESTA